MTEESTKSRGFYPLRVKAVKRETSDAVSIAFEVPESDREAFRFMPGQYLTLKFDREGEELRRSYSICTAPDEEELKIAVKRVDQGKVSTYLDREVKEGDVLEVMRPMGNFTFTGEEEGTYFGFAAGSGITPVMSILKAVLQANNSNRFVLVYGNRSREAVIFREELAMLKQRFADRLEVHYVYSREDGGVLKGRIDDHCLTRLEMQGMKWNGKAYFLCGPSDMITNVSKALETRGIAPDQIRYELFTTPAPTEYEGGEQQPAEEEELAEGNPVAKVRILLDDDETEIELKKDGASVLDAAIKAGIDPPYSCKGAVCTTCMAKVLSGKVRMDMNHALSDGELDEGYVLTCQSHPVSDEVSISYDEV